MFWAVVMFAGMGGICAFFGWYGGSTIGFAKGWIAGREDAIAEIELNGVRRGMIDAGRTSLPREGARPARVSRIRFNSKIK